MSEPPGILHADLDAFYASVEQRDDPALRGRPVLVGAGVVLAASYEAKARGVRTAMGVHQALRLCPGAVVVPPRMDAYLTASRAVFEIFRDTTPLVEPVSVDEAFLDVRGLRAIRGDSVAIAHRLRCEVRSRAGLPITVGVAGTKFLAKVASAVGKPDGLLVVPVGEELAFLHPLPVGRLWGVGRVTAATLQAHGVSTVADVAELDERALVAMLGPAAGAHLYALARNRDARPVVTGRRRRSIGSQSALGRRSLSPTELDARLLTLVERVCRRLRAADRTCRTVVLRLRFDDFTRATRSHTLAAPTSQTATVLGALRRLVDDCSALIRERGITLIGVSLANLDDGGALQLELPFDKRDAARLDSVVDRVRDRYGTRSLTRGVVLGRDVGPTVPMLPD